MERPAAQFGSYVDMKFMRGLKVARVSIDIPIEESDQFLRMFGAPSGVDPIPVCIARLMPGVPAQTVEPGSSNGRTSAFGADSEGSSPSPGAKRQYSRSQIAALKCRDAAFQEWIADADHTQEARHHLTPEDFANAVLKERLGITSKRELDLEGPKAVAFDQLLTDFDLREMVR